MNSTKARKTRAARDLIAANYPDKIKQACEEKLKMPNRNGYLQHRVISPRRQVKKMVLREGLA